MSSHEPLTFELKEGVDAYNPEVVKDVLKFLTLNNVEPRLGRLFATKGYAIFQDLELATGDRIVSFGFYQLRERQYYNLYAFSRTSVYWFDFSILAFEIVPIYDQFYASDEPYVILQWIDCMYVTKPFQKLTKIERKIVTPIDGAPFARYGIVANSHAYLGGVGTHLYYNLAQIRWSDLEDFEMWLTNPNENESDFFDLEPESRQITGQSMQRGSPLTYTETDIWIATYIGFPGGFRHEQLLTGIGCIFHGAVVRNKEIDFFIGQDNFYALNGFQLVPIGDDIFERFIADVKITGTTRVPGYLDSQKNQVFWVYTRQDDTLWSVVYNYKEKKWSERDPQDLTAWLDTPRIIMRGYDVIDDISDIIDDVPDLIDDPDGGFPALLPQFVGAKPSIGGVLTPLVANPSNNYLKLDGNIFEHIIETFDFYFVDLGNVNEVTKALIEFTGTGDVDLAVTIGARKNQSEDVTWASPRDVDKDTDGSLAFFLRDVGVGKFLRFQFDFGNTETDNIDDLRLLSLIKIEDDDEPEE